MQARRGARIHACGVGGGVCLFCFFEEIRWSLQLGRMVFSKYTRTVHARARRGGPCPETRPGHVSE
jgi:hypothetical protein